MRKPNAIQVQDFLLVLASQNTLFTLEAEHEPTGRVFTNNLDGDSIGQVTNGLFDSADKMVEGLKEAAETNSENVRLDINLEGKLAYTVLFTSGVIKKEFGFTLNLTEKEMEPIQIFSRKLDSAKKDMEERTEAQEYKMQTLESKIEERFDKLENMILQMEQKMGQRLDTLEKLYDNLKSSVVFTPNIYFNRKSVNAAKFVLSDNYKTASLKESDHYPCLELLPQIPSSGKHSYSLQIKKKLDPENRALGFGITTETEKANWNDKKCNYRYSTLGGKILGREEKDPYGNGPFGLNNQVLTMVVDMDKGTLTIFVNNIQVNACPISKSDKYFVYISLRDAGDSVTLI